MANRKNIPLENLFAIAAGLKSDHGENPEYDRALVEVCTEASGASMDDKPQTAAQLGITLQAVSGDLALRAAAGDLLAACKAAAALAWEVGCESEDGVLTLLEDSRGDLYRKLSTAIVKATK